MIKVSPPRKRSLVSIFVPTIVAAGVTIESSMGFVVDAPIPTAAAFVARIVWEAVPTWMDGDMSVIGATTSVTNQRAIRVGYIRTCPDPAEVAQKLFLELVETPKLALQLVESRSHFQTPPALG